MCVAAIISKPISLHYLNQMENHNPHGAGVAWVEPGADKVTWKKGLTAAEIFAMQESGELKLPYMLHFRWATQGEICAELTHPFPVGIQALFPAVEGAAERLLIHNGTWNGAPEWDARFDIPDGLMDHLSDTAQVAYLMEANPAILKEVRWATAVGSVRDGALSVEFGGTWYPSDGNTYSNLNWKPAKVYKDWRKLGWEPEPKVEKKWESFDDFWQNKLEVLEAIADDEIQGQIENLIENPRENFQDEAIIKYLDLMTDDQWKRYTDARFPPTPEATFYGEDVVSEDYDIVNAYIGRAL
jgi:hypothetical protein